MIWEGWKTPAWGTATEAATRVELFYVPEREIIDHAGWPKSFWTRTQQRVSLHGHEARSVIEMFQGLELAEPARCHMPPWGLAMYSDAELLFTATLCFECSNAYVYAASGRNLRAFDTRSAKATELLATLQLHLPLS
jgi:hypothetical protein